MAATPETLAKLRRQLAERFPTAPRASGRTLTTGITAFDEATGGLPLSAVTEIVCAAPSCGSHLLLGQLLAITRTAQNRVALIDGSDGFDPTSCVSDHLAHLVWVRCPNTGIALQAADILTRDANFGLVVLDLRRAPEIELRRIPPTFWYRLQRAIETTDLALVIFTPRISISSAQLRFLLDRSQPAAALERDRPLLLAELALVRQRQRLHSASVG